jgi:hypothetical protein
MPGTGNPFIEESYWAMASANKKAQRLAKFEFQPHLASPDCSPVFECSAHSGSAVGNSFIAVNVTDAAQSLTVNTTPYLESGQQFIQDLGDFTGDRATPIASGTASVSVSVPAGGSLALLFPLNFASELQQPSISPKLSDVTGAASIVVRYAYLPYWVDNGTALMNCGAMATPCVLPVDKAFGTVYYRVIYLDSASNVLATSDIEQI